MTMKRIMTILVFIVLFICSCISGSHAYAHPHHRATRFPWAHPRFLPLPILKDPKFQPCIRALHQRYKTCISAITSSYNSQHLTISENCCDSIEEVDKECASTLFSRIKAPLVHLLFKEHCANKGCQPALPPKVGDSQPISPVPQPPQVGDSQPISPVPQPPQVGDTEPISPPAPEPSDDEPGEPVYPPMGPDVPGDYDPLAPSPSPESGSPTSD